MHATGVSGELRVGYRVAGGIGAWRIRPVEDRVGYVYRVWITLRHVVPYWWDQRPIDLWLAMGSSWWVWRGVDLGSAPQSQPIVVEGAPEIVAR